MEKWGAKLQNKLLFALKKHGSATAITFKFCVYILGRAVGNFHVICESLPGIVTSYVGNLLKPKVYNNLRLTAADFIKNIQDTDWTMIKRLSYYQRCASKTASVTGVLFFSFTPI